MHNKISRPCQLDESITNKRDVVLYFTVEFKFQKYIFLANGVAPDQMRCSLAADLVMHCLPMSHKMEAMP